MSNKQYQVQRSCISLHSMLVIMMTCDPKLHITRYVTITSYFRPLFCWRPLAGAVLDPRCSSVCDCVITGGIIVPARVRLTVADSLKPEGPATGSSSILGLLKGTAVRRALLYGFMCALCIFAGLPLRNWDVSLVGRIYWCRGGKYANFTNFWLSERKHEKQCMRERI